MQISHKELSRNLESKELRPQFRGSLLCRAQGPSGRLQNSLLQEGIRTGQKRTNSTVESKGATAADTIFLEGFNRANCDTFVASKTREVVAARFKTCLPVLTSLGLGPLAPETTGAETRSDCSSGVMGIGDTQRFRCPFVNKLIDVLLDGIRYIDGRTLARTNLFRKMNEVFLSAGCKGAGLKKGANDEKCQQKFEDRAAWVVLM